MYPIRSLAMYVVSSFATVPRKQFPEGVESEGHDARQIHEMSLQDNEVAECKVRPYRYERLAV